MDDDSEKRKAKGTKKCIIRFELMVENCKHCLFSETVILRSQKRIKSDQHEIYTEEVNKIALSGDDDKGLQTFGWIETYLHGTNPFIVCESERLIVAEAKENIKMMKNM